MCNHANATAETTDTIDATMALATDHATDDETLDISAEPETAGPDDEEIGTCDHCGSGVPTDELDDAEHCPSCADEFHDCGHCGRSVHTDDSTPVDDDAICDRCLNRHYTQCDDCNEYVRRNDSYSTPSGYACEDCYSNNYFVCDGCNETFSNDDYCENGLCNECSQAANRGPIQDYGDDCELAFLGTPKDRIYYGVELEVESGDVSDRTDDAEETISTLGSDFVMCKEDGSLREDRDNGPSPPNRGFEIVTAPASFAVHAERWPKFLDSPPTSLTSWKSGRCGMHVHVSRKPLSQLTIGKILVFINAKENTVFVNDVAGRGENGYAKRFPKKLTDGAKHSDYRYQAVNLCNDATVEFRIFRGTLKRESFFKNLEFVAATVAFCRWTGNAELMVKHFIAFVDGRRRDYPNLVAWLRDNDYLPLPKPKKEGL